MDGGTVAILGAGAVGVAFARAWSANGISCQLFVRRPRPDLAGLVNVTDSPTVLTEADVVFLAVPGRDLPKVLEDYGDLFRGKVLIDATNNLGGPAVTQTGIRRAELHQEPLVKRVLPSTEWYRVFNTYGFESTVSQDLLEGSPDILFCGDPGPGMSLVEKLIEALGCRPIWVGGSEEAGLLDGLTYLWFQLAFARNLGRNLGFRIINAERPAPSE